MFSFAFLHLRFFCSCPKPLYLINQWQACYFFISRQAGVAYAAIGVGVELCKVVSHRVGSRMPYLQKQTGSRNH
ncbi:hypothetical protein TB1_014536 [Malus domestica]